MIVSRARRLALVLFASTALPSTAQALKCEWLGGTGNFSSRGNWHCGVVPSATDIAIVNIGTPTLASGERSSLAGLSLGSNGTVIVAGRMDSPVITNIGRVIITGASGMLTRHANAVIKGLARRCCRVRAR